MSTNENKSRSVNEIMGVAEQAGIQNLLAEFSEALTKQMLARVNGAIQQSMGVAFAEPLSATGATVVAPTAPRRGRPPGRGTGKHPVVARGEGKRSLARPCPIPGCTGQAAPRFGMVCKDHYSLPKNEKEIFRVKAKQEGGVWNHLTASKAG